MTEQSTLSGKLRFHIIPFGLSLMAINTPVCAETREAPAILQFAHKYQQQEQKTPRSAPVSGTARSGERLSNHTKFTPKTAPSTEKTPSGFSQLQRSMAQKEQEIAAQNHTIEALKKQLAALQQQKRSVPPLASDQDIKAVSQMMAELQRMFTLRSSPEILEKKLKQAIQRVSAAHATETAMRQELEITKTKAIQNREKTQQLESSLRQLRDKKEKLEEEKRTLQVQLDAEKKASSGKIHTLQAKLDAAPGHTNLPQITTDTLKQKPIREAYAMGLSLGTEILQLQAENRNWAATDSNQPGVLAGIIDVFQGNEKLPPEELQKTLMDISKKVKTGREKYIADLKKSTQTFTQNFIKQKQTKKSPAGFWYQIGYTGDSPIPQNAVLDVVVKESLANGTVIEDMEAKGMVLTQPVSAFPPVFQEVLRKLKNHGSVTIVVPPELAYGKKGFPPKIPPDATMIYDLRIAEIYPENMKTAPEKQ